MGANAIARSTVQAQAFTAHHLSPRDDSINALTAAEKGFLAAMRLLLNNGLTYACDTAAKEFLQVAPTDRAVRRRAHALLRLAWERDRSIVKRMERGGLTHPVSGPPDAGLVNV
jgi:hypothetical protein